MTVPYIDSSRGHRRRHDRQDVRGGGAGDRVRHGGQRGVWGGTAGVGNDMKRAWPVAGIGATDNSSSLL